MATFSNIDGEESATVTFTVAAVSLTRNSSAELQEILCIGDPDVSTNIARVNSSHPDSTEAGLVVRQVGFSTTHNVSSVGGAVIVRSSAADFAATVSGNVGQASTVWAVQVDGRVRAQNSTIGDLLASVQQNSTVWAVQVDGRVRAQNSTIGDLLASVQQNSTVWAVQVDGRVRAQNSTIGDLLASVQQNSTVWQTQAAVRTSSGAGVEGSTGVPERGALGLNVRPIVPLLHSAFASTAGATSTNTVLVSSQAGIHYCVYAFSITSTVAAASTISFRSSLANVNWPLRLGSQSSGVTGANLAVTPPAYLFRTSSAGNALTFHVPSSGAEYDVVVSYFESTNTA